MSPITDARIEEIARKFCQYEAASKVVTLRGQGIVEFARALLAEHEGERVAALLSVRAALDGQEHTPPGTHGAPAAPKLEVAG